MTAPEVRSAFAPATAPRPPERIPEVLDAVAAWWLAPGHHSQRLGQILTHVADALGGTVLDLEDEDLYQVLTLANHMPIQRAAEKWKERQDDG